MVKRVIVSLALLAAVLAAPEAHATKDCVTASTGGPVGFGPNTHCVPVENPGNFTIWHKFWTCHGVPPVQNFSACVTVIVWLPV